MQTLLRAAELLEEDATVLRESCTNPVSGEWSDDEIDAGTKAEHDERVLVASQLRACAASWPDLLMALQMMLALNASPEAQTQARIAIAKATAGIDSHRASDAGSD